VFHGHVDQVATVDSKQDFMTADVKVYQTIISIEEEESAKVPGLKPGMSSEVTVLINRVPHPVLTVPVQAIVDSLETGRRTCFVLNLDGEVEEREVEVGLSNDKKAEIRSGLKEGERVVLNPASLLKDRRKTKGSGKGEKKGPSFGPGKKPQGNGKGPGPAVPGPGGKPVAGPGPSGPPAGGNIQMSPEDRQKMFQQMVDRFRQAKPADRKQMLMQIPEQFREQAKQGLKAQGIEIPD